jgi:cytoskeletal protein CcmA (bactofilin family)
MTTTLIARRTRVGGPIDTEGDVVVEGRVEGSIRAGGSVTVGPSGVALSDLVVGRAVVLGIVIGDVTATERVDVAAGARVVGDVRAPTVAVVPPGTIEGKIDETRESQSLRPTLRIRGGQPLVRPARPEAAPGWSRAPTAPLPPVPPAPYPSARPAPPTEQVAALVPAPPRPVGRVRMVPRRNNGDR